MCMTTTTMTLPTIRLTFAATLLALLVLTGCGARQKRGFQPPPAKKAPPVPAARNVPLDPQLRGQAQAEVDKALRDADGRTRANALEILSNVPGTPRRAEIVAALSDPEAGVRGSAATAVGDLKLAEAQPRLLQMSDDRDPVVQVSVRYALHRLGNFKYSHDLEKSARSTEWSVRAQTALVLGMLQERSAMKILRVLQRDRNAAVRQQALEAMWRMGDEEAMKQLVGYTASRFVDDQMIALQALAAPRDHRMKDLLEAYLTTDYVEVNLTAARALGQLDSDRGYGVVLEASASSDPLHRFLAARALATIGRTDSQDLLRKLLVDSSPRVRLAAAGAVLQLKKPGA
jgi:HEAT repeat protein